MDKIPQTDGPRDHVIDKIENIITDSIDVDWTPKTAAVAVHDDMVGPLVVLLEKIEQQLDYGQVDPAAKLARAALQYAGHPAYQED